MGGETIKALLMIAMFGLFEAAMNVEKVQRLRGALVRRLKMVWHSVAPSPALQPIRAGAKRRKG